MEGNKGPVRAPSSDRDELGFRDMAESLNHIVWTCNSEGTCDYLSPQWSGFTGHPAEGQLGMGWLQSLHPSDRDEVVDAWKVAFRDETPYHLEFRLLRHDG